MVEVQKGFCVWLKGRGLSILVVLALVLGVYQMWRTVLISDDGALHVRQAQAFERDPGAVLKKERFLYPLMVFVAEKPLQYLLGDSSDTVWILAAQAVSLFLRLIALVLLYHFGKALVGADRALLGLLLLIVLPYPARWGADGLREWPHLAFLAAGVVCLLKWPARPWLISAAVGLIAGVGCWLRLECCQLLVYGAIVLLLYDFSRHAGERAFTGRAACLLMFGVFLLVFLPISAYQHHAALAKVGRLFSSLGADASEGWPRAFSPVAAVFPGRLAEGVVQIAGLWSKVLLYIAALPVFVGLWRFAANRRRYPEGPAALLTLVVVTNVLMLLAAYHRYEYLSERYVLPLAAMTIFLAPVGIEELGRLIVRERRETTARGAGSLDPGRRMAQYAIYAAVVLCCTPKLLSPVRAEKTGLRAAADWLRENTPAEAVVAVPDRRVGLYAQRKSVVYEELSKPPVKVNYLVAVSREGDAEPAFGPGCRMIQSFPYGSAKADRTVDVYRAEAPGVRELSGVTSPSYGP